MRSDSPSLWVSLGLIVAVAIGIFTFAKCEPEDGSSQPDKGTWYEVRPPPDAPEGTKCWVWQVGVLDNRAGGPICFPPA